MVDFAKLILGVDTRGLKDGQRELDRTGDRAKRTANEVDGAASKMGSAFKKVGVALVAAGITNVLFDFGKKSVQAAIDAEEMGSAFNVVFGSMAEDVRAWAEETGNALGRSTQEIQRGALAFQELFGKALQPEKAAELSKQFAVLTQDLASFKNLSNEVAQQKLFSGLTGEAEPLRAVGVFLNETAVKAKAAELGLRGVNGVLTDQEKIVARAAVIQEQLAQASGDVARTSGSTANQIKTYEAAVEELQVAIGSKLLPQLTPLITLTAEVVTLMAQAAQNINVTANTTENLVEGVRVVTGRIGKLTSGLRDFVTGIGLAAEKIDGLASRAFRLINPLAGVLNQLERIGAASRAQASAERLLTGDFSTNFITGELAAMSQSIDNINAPNVLPKLGENLEKTGSSGKSAASGMTAAERAAKIIEERFESAANAAANLRRELDAVLAKADPARARGQQLFADIGTLFEAERAGLISPEERQAEGNRLLGQNVPESVKRSKDAAEELMRGMADLGSTSKEITTAISDNFAQMADRTLQALDRMVGAIRGGGFLDILSSVINFGIQLGGMGAFGSKIQSNILAGARANGGQVNAGRAYLVGERGPELFMPQAHGQIVANDNMRGGGMTINVDARGSSDPEAVRRQVQQGILEAAPSIVAAAEQRTISTLRRPRLAGVM